MDIIYTQRTQLGFLWSRVLKTPLWAIYSLLPFILYQEMKATTDHPPIPIAIMIAMKPMVAIFSLYWSSAISMRRDRLVSNIIGASVLGVIPFFFFPYFENPWYFVFSSGVYMMFHRGSIPAWMEIIRLNIPGISGKKIFAYGAAIGYIGDGVLPFLFGPLLDGYFQYWRWIFPVVALLSLLAVIFQYRILIKADTTPQANLERSLFNPLKPWKEALNLLATRKDFRQFQLGFMLGGSGLMIMHAVLPAYFKGVLHLSWTELAVALTFCKGVGFAATSQSWANWMHRIDIYRASSFVTLIACLFPLCLLAANFHIFWVYGAYIIYGIMQAGSELSWNMSGPIFSKEEDSSVFSSVNVVTVGIRGCIAPLIGTFLLYISNPALALALGGIFCLAATFTMASNSRIHGAVILE